MEGHHPLLKQPPSAQEPRGAPAHDDTQSQVPSLQLPADLHQHSVIFTYSACGMYLAELSGGGLTCCGGWLLSPALSPSQVGIRVQL